MKLRIAHTGDLHITRGPRLQDQAATMTAMVDDMLSTRPDLVLIVGDAYGHTVPHLSHPDERAVLFAAVTRLAERCPVVYVAGNHDDPSDVAGLAHLATEWTITVATTAAVLTIITPAGPVEVYALPYPTKRWLLAGAGAMPLAEAHQRANDAMERLLATWAHRARRTRAKTPRMPIILAAHVAVTGAQLAGGEVLSGHEIEVSRAALEAIPVDYGALGHLHLAQEPALRCHYPGSPWRNDHSERDAKGWHAITIGDGGNLQATANSYPSTDDGRLSASVWRVATACRTFVTLDFRWAPDHDGGAPRWVERPTDEAIALCRDAEVRARLIVSEQWVGGCPWDDELAALARIAVRVQAERRIEPVLRVRAPLVASANTPAEKLRYFWLSLATHPTPAECATALAGLDELTDGA